MKSDSRADMMHDCPELASGFIKTLFCVLYEVYSSSVRCVCSWCQLQCRCTCTVHTCIYMYTYVVAYMLYTCTMYMYMYIHCIQKLFASVWEVGNGNVDKSVCRWREVHGLGSDM